MSPVLKGSGVYICYVSDEEDVVRSDHLGPHIATALTQYPCRFHLFASCAFALWNSVFAFIGGELSIYRELLQNADDASAESVQIRFYTAAGAAAEDARDEEDSKDVKGQEAAVASEQKQPHQESSKPQSFQYEQQKPQQQRGDPPDIKSDIVRYVFLNDGVCALEHPASMCDLLQYFLCLRISSPRLSSRSLCGRF